MHIHTIPDEIITDHIVPYLVTMPSSLEEEKATYTFSCLYFLFQNKKSDIENLSLTNTYFLNLLQKYKIDNVTAKDLLTYVQKETKKQCILIFNHEVDSKKVGFLESTFLEKKPLIKAMSLNIALSKNAEYMHIFFPSINEDRKKDAIYVFELYIETPKYILDDTKKKYNNANYHGEKRFDIPLVGYEEIVNCINKTESDFNLCPLITYITEYIKKNSKSTDKKISQLLLSYKLLENAINNEKKAVHKNEILISSNIYFFGPNDNFFKLIIRVAFSSENDTIPLCLLRQSALNTSKK